MKVTHLHWIWTVLRLYTWDTSALANHSTRLADPAYSTVQKAPSPPTSTLPCAILKLCSKWLHHPIPFLHPPPWSRPGQTQSTQQHLVLTNTRIQFNCEDKIGLPYSSETHHTGGFLHSIPRTHQTTPPRDACAFRGTSGTKGSHVEFPTHTETS